MKSLPLPGWLLVIFSTAFVLIWVFAPRESFSGPPHVTLDPEGLLPEQRNPAPTPPVLRVSPEYPVTPLPLGPTAGLVHHRPWEVAFTFDDGPHHLYTPRLLDIVDKHQVKATFFINGCWLDHHGSKSARNRAIVKDAHRRGHTIANHSYSHANFFNISREMQIQEVLTNEDIIYQTIGVRPTLFRVPYAVKVERFLPLLKSLGYVVAKWNASAPDDEIDDPVEIKNIVMGWIRHNHGGIVMLHDNHRWSVAATELILQALERHNCRQRALRKPTLRIVSLPSFLLPPEKAHGALADGRDNCPSCKN